MHSELEWIKVNFDSTHTESDVNITKTFSVLDLQ